MKISVIIPCYQAEKTIHKCINSVLANDYKDYELIIVDDASTDATQKIITEFKAPQIKCFFNQKNRGPSFSRNYGLKMAQGEIMLLLDADTYVKEDWMRKHLEKQQTIEADIIGGGISGIHKTIFGKADGFCAWWTSIPERKEYYLKKHHLPTNNLSIKRKVFEKIGFFREDLISGGEDSEFCFRALKANLKIFFVSDVLVYHQDRDAFKSFLQHQENWGKCSGKMRKDLKMDYCFVLPKSYRQACFYILPLAILYTLFIIGCWFRYRPSVVLYAPLIFIGKLKQAMAIKNSYR